jgi:hypothetical protein
MAQSSWLHPSDREYQYAIDSASAEPKVTTDDAEALEFIRTLSDETNSYVSVRPPLACANLHAETQKQQFALAPTVDEVKKECDGQLLVAVRYFFAPLELDRSLVIEHGDHHFKPSHSSYDSAHPIIAVDDAIDSAPSEYAYLDLHVVVPDAAWDDDVMFVAADVNGQPAMLTFNFSSQVKNEQQIDSASR